jgi:tryptophan halogenase
LSWLSVLVGQNIIPRRYDPMVDGLDSGKIQSKLDEVRDAVRRCADAMPSHEDFIAQHCAGRNRHSRPSRP